MQNQCKTNATEFVPTWGHLPHVTVLTLNRLGRRQCTELVESLCAGKALPAEVLDQMLITIISVGMAPSLTLVIEG